MPNRNAPHMEEIVETRSLIVAERPITFDEFLRWFGPKDEVELVDGVAQRRTPANLDYAHLYGFLLSLLGCRAEETRSGLFLGPRTAVRISPFRGRLPDLLFVRQANVLRLEKDALRFAPDLVIKIVLPEDRRSEVFALETDYRSIGVPEIIFIDQPQRTVRVLRKQAGDAAEACYKEQTLRPGESLRLDTLGGVLLPLDWLLTEPRPTVFAALATWGIPSPEGIEPPHAPLLT